MDDDALWTPADRPAADAVNLPADEVDLDSLGYEAADPSLLAYLRADGGSEFRA